MSGVEDLFPGSCNKDFGLSDLRAEWADSEVGGGPLSRGCAVLATEVEVVKIKAGLTRCLKHVRIILYCRRQQLPAFGMDFFRCLCAQKRCNTPEPPQILYYMTVLAVAADVSYICLFAYQH